MSDIWSSQGFGESFVGDPDEMLVVHNTFLELCKMADLQAVNADRFISAPATFGISLSSPPKHNQTTKSSDFGERVEQEAAEPSMGEAPTTIMMRNIPTRISARTLLDVLQGAFTTTSVVELVDFVYLPIDFKTNKNLGYAFINFANASNASDCIAKLNDKKYVFCETSEKQLQITYSNRQGYMKNLEVFTQTKMLDTWPDIFRPLARSNGTLVPVSSDLLAQILG